MSQSVYLDGQKVIKQVLIDLGGKATSTEIRAEVARRVAQGTASASQIDTYSISLTRLRKWREVNEYRDKATGKMYWVITCPECHKPKQGGACGCRK
jgi:hypothetical protein